MKLEHVKELLKWFEANKIILINEEIIGEIDLDSVKIDNEYLYDVLSENKICEDKK